MPELPEVETVTRQVSQVCLNGIITKAKINRPDLRFPIPVKEVKGTLLGNKILKVWRRSKYLILGTAKGDVILHLGMSGNIIFRSVEKPLVPHTHAVFSGLSQDGEPFHFHFSDPRRFGCILAAKNAEQHRLFENLGPEPLDERFDLSAHLYARAAGKNRPVKAFLMDAHNVVGVGNIYACESLFSSAIHPEMPVGQLKKRDWNRLTRAIRATLKRAIKAGGTTLKDYKSAEGTGGYFKVSLAVYGKEGASCHKCKSNIANIRLSGRSTFYCPRCQKK